MQPNKLFVIEKINNGWILRIPSEEDDKPEQQWYSSTLKKLIIRLGTIVNEPI